MSEEVEIDCPNKIEEIADNSEGSFVRLLAHLNDLFQDIPQENRENARCRIALSYGHYDDPTELVADVFYVRMKTQEELAAEKTAHIARLQRAQEQEEAWERAELSRLRAKYGVAS